MRRYALLLLAALAPITPASANPGSDYCARGLVLTDIRLRQTLDRLTATRQSPMPQRCTAFRDHIRIMSAAARVYDRCNTGRTRQENVGQMQGSVADFREIVDRNCR